MTSIDASCDRRPAAAAPARNISRDWRRAACEISMTVVSLKIYLLTVSPCYAILRYINRQEKHDVWYETQGSGLRAGGLGRRTPLAAPPGRRLRRPARHGRRRHGARRAHAGAGRPAADRA